jgi:hypothetical protein
MNVYVVLFHDVWALGRDPGVENENGEPEETSIDVIFDNRLAADAYVKQHADTFPDLDPAMAFLTIEEHELKS